MERKSPVSASVVLVLTLASSALLPLSLPNPIFSYGSPLLGIVALIPLYIAIKVTRTLRLAVYSGIVFGAFSTAFGSFWLAFFEDFSAWAIGGPVLGYMAYNALLFTFLYKAMQTRLPFRPLYFAVIWTGYELLKSIGFLGYPWGLVAYSWNEVIPFIQIADIFGVYAISFLLVLANTVLAEWLHGVRSRALIQLTALLAVLSGITWVYGFTALQRETHLRAELDIVMVQNNGDPWAPGVFWDQLEHTQNLTLDALQHSEGNPDLIIWSESILRIPLDDQRSLYRSNPRGLPFLQFIAELPADLLTGGAYTIDSEKSDMINAALLIDRSGTIQQVYGKQQLVPMVETIPFFEFSPVRSFFQNVVGLRSMWLSGMEYRMFPITTTEGIQLQYGTPICFEDAFAYITRDMVHEGADFFINLTNNSWSKTESAQTQHLAAARFRSIETRRTLIRSTNSGYTSVIDPWGRVTVSLPMFTESALRTKVEIRTPIREPIQLFIGNAFGWLCFAVAAAGLGIQYKRPPT